MGVKIVCVVEGEWGEPRPVPNRMQLAASSYPLNCGNACLLRSPRNLEQHLKQDQKPIPLLYPRLQGRRVRVCLESCLIRSAQGRAVQEDIRPTVFDFLIADAGSCCRPGRSGLFFLAIESVEDLVDYIVRQLEMLNVDRLVELTDGE